MIHLLFLAGAVLLPPAPRVPDAAFRAVVLSALRAVEQDSTAMLRGRWTSALAADRHDEVAALGLATLDRLTYDYRAADAGYRALLTPARRGAGAAHRYATLGLGQSFASRWQADSALRYLRDAGEQARAAGDPQVETEALLLLARLEARRVGLDSVDAMIRRAEAVVPGGSPHLVALVRCLRGSWLRARSPARADSMIAEGLAAARVSGIQRVQAVCLFVRGTIREFTGDQPGATAIFRDTERMMREAHDLEQLAAAQQWRAYTTIQFTADFAAGRRLADEAIVAGERSGNTLVVPWALLNMAQLALKLGDLGAVDRLTREAETGMRQLGDQSGWASVQVVRGDAARLGGRLADAYSSYERAAQRYEQLGLPSYRAPRLLAQAGVMRELGQPDAAAAHLAAAIALAKRSGADGVLTEAVYEGGLQALARGEWKAALAQLQRFLALTATSFPQYEYDVRMRMAEARSAAGAHAEAERELERASAVLARWRESLRDRSARLALLDSRRIDYDPTLGLATTVSRLAGAGRVEAALRAAEDRRAQVLWQQMARRASLGREAAPTARPAASARDGLLEGLGAALPDSTALVVYVTGRGTEPTTVFVVQRRGTIARTLASAESLAAPIRRFVTVLESGADAPLLARQLGTALLAPVLDGLAPGISRLVVVPDGPLHRVPFDALLLADGAPVIERFTVSLAPSARIARQWRAAPRERGHTGVLAFADPAYDPAAGLVRLVASGAEGRDLVSVSGNARLRTREAASEAALKRADLRRLGVLHLATHARAQDWGVLESAIFLAPGEGEDGRLGPEEIAALALDVDLVVLSGCRTIGGAIVSGEGVQGLAAPFLEAGARAVAATYWEVGDREMADLMRRFYRELGAGRTAADALRRAKLALRRGGAPASAWAAMSLLGDPGVQPEVAAGPGRN